MRLMNLPKHRRSPCDKPRSIKNWAEKRRYIKIIIIFSIANPIEFPKNVLAVSVQIVISYKNGNPDLCLYRKTILDVYSEMLCQLATLSLPFGQFRLPVLGLCSYSHCKPVPGTGLC